ncbi:MAG: succinylglutamate desuccinylase/aspartoacylase family protein [Armatimonadota bacterium]|nr:succinylglutamate desuccinylase/aspartoacylase family protein [Armatimonadota bacterium]MDR7464614.1 succinylglutamate desuccinylase/aspartoacylase family protein [Armatimonadota bacterium]MDR7469728.1 succinylglutamate desuccinylase/aspartoacylase family protein [Armatimonadota bacterium]MDR7473939.1 succinylglutamate desuccinylase/aspartoacylase family protein [Armatimonadota bacterium]MDR7539010.1 succinylglutamate desuccinylase/aspartoacylase family protein [Armatimonadota bacterium]
MQRTLQVAGVAAAPGQRVLGEVVAGELPDGTPVRIPLVVLNGVADGPILWLGAGLHGTEVPGMEVIRQVVREVVDPARLRGAVVAAPLLNPFSFHQHQMLTPQDGYNLNRVFPGDARMLLSHRLAALIARLAEGCDAYMDFHANPTPALQFSIVKHSADAALWQRSRALAQAFGVTTIEMIPAHERHRTGTFTDMVQQWGKPCLVLELIAWRRIDPVSLRTGVRGTLNVMRHLGMLDGEIEPQEGIPIIEGPLSRIELTANRGGLVFPLKDAGEPVREGETIGVVRNLWGDVVEEVRTPRDGWILAWPLLGNQAVATGDILTFIAFRR